MLHNIDRTFAMNQTLAGPCGLADGSHRGLGPQVLQQGGGGEDQGCRGCLHPHCSVVHPFPLWRNISSWHNQKTGNNCEPLSEKISQLCHVYPRQELAATFCILGDHDGGGGCGTLLAPCSHHMQVAKIPSGELMFGDDKMFLETSPSWPEEATTITQSSIEW